jgi:hypothetical protein
MRREQAVRAHHPSHTPGTCANAREAQSRHSVSLAIETFVSRATSSSGSPRNSRATIAIFH